MEKRGMQRQKKDRLTLLIWRIGSVVLALCMLMRETAGSSEEGSDSDMPYEFLMEDIQVAKPRKTAVIEKFNREYRAAVKEKKYVPVFLLQSLDSVLGGKAEEEEGQRKEEEGAGPSEEQEAFSMHTLLEEMARSVRAADKALFRVLTERFLKDLQIMIRHMQALVMKECFEMYTLEGGRKFMEELVAAGGGMEELRAVGIDSEFLRTIKGNCVITAHLREKIFKIVHECVLGDLYSTMVGWECLLYVDETKLSDGARMRVHWLKLIIWRLRRKRVCTRNGAACGKKTSCAGIACLCEDLIGINNVLNRMRYLQYK